MAEEEESGTPAATLPLTQELCVIMDMSVTDKDGFEIVDNSREISLLKDNGKHTRRQRTKNEEGEEDGPTERNRSKAQAPKREKIKRTIKGARSDPYDSNAAKLFKQGNDLVTGAAWNSWREEDKDIEMAQGKGSDALQAMDPWAQRVPESDGEEMKASDHKTETRTPTQDIMKVSTPRVKRLVFSPKPSAAKAGVSKRGNRGEARPKRRHKQSARRDGNPQAKWWRPSEGSSTECTSTRWQLS